MTQPPFRFPAVTAILFVAAVAASASPPRQPAAAAPASSRSIRTVPSYTTSGSLSVTVAGPLTVFQPITDRHVVATLRNLGEGPITLSIERQGGPTQLSLNRRTSTVRELTHVSAITATCDTSPTGLCELGYGLVVAPSRTPGVDDFGTWVATPTVSTTGSINCGDLELVYSNDETDGRDLWVHPSRSDPHEDSNLTLSVVIADGPILNLPILHGRSTPEFEFDNVRSMEVRCYSNCSNCPCRPCDYEVSFGYQSVEFR